MNFLTKFLFTIFTVAAMSLAVSAQRGDKDEKKPPPKPKDSPVVRPGDKDEKKPPRDPKKPKRPEEEMSFVLVIDRRKADAA